MYDCEVEIRPMGQADTAQSDPTLAQRLERVAGRPGEFAFHRVEAVGGSEDFTEMMRAVQSRGGLATSLGIGADAHGTRRDTADRSCVLAPHSATFDFDERALGIAVRVLSRLVVDLGRRTEAMERRIGSVGIGSSVPRAFGQMAAERGLDKRVETGY